MADDSLSPNETSQTTEDETQSRVKSKVVWIVIAGLIILGALITGIVFLARTDSLTTSHIRDIFIIVLALESLIIGAALVILVVQLALLINLLQNEIKPILETTRRTVNSLKGTTAFLSEHAVKPVVNIGSMAAGLKRLGEIIGIIKN
jgi:hypothetical protein